VRSGERDVRVSDIRDIDTPLLHSEHRDRARSVSI